MTRVTREKMVQLINNDKIAMDVVGRALVHLMERQTFDEKTSERTKHHNLRGFTPGDARMGTSMAKQYKFKGWLSEKQVNFWKVRNVKGVPRIAKYHAQLNEEAERRSA